LKLTFRSTPQHNLESLIDREDECPASSLKILGYPLIIRNLWVVQKIFSIDTIYIPDQFSNASRLIQDNFPALNLKEFSDDFTKDTHTNTASFVGHAPHNTSYHITIPIQGDTDNLDTNKLINT